MRRPDTLLSILRDGLKLSYCSEIITDNISLGIPMVSFCDIPLLSCREHRSKYGLYAIGFSKKTFSELPSGCEIGPVRYFTVQQTKLTDKLVSLVTNRDKTVGWTKPFEMPRKGKNPNKL